MGIRNEDVKLFESQRLSDEEDGCGRAAGTEVIDGNVNNLFHDISRIDRTIGDVALRKAYVVPGTTASFELLGNKTEGQRSITGVQREENRLPEVGEVYRLYNPDTKKEQYVRLTKVESRIEVFTYQYGDNNFVDFERRRIDTEISAALLYTFPGGIPTPAGTQMPADSEGIFTEKTLVQGTQIADASRYYGIKPTTAAISKGDLSLRVDSVYAPLVPSARVESPVVDQYGGYTAKRMIATAASVRNVNPKFVHLTGHQSRAFLQTGALPAGNRNADYGWWQLCG